MNLDAPGVVVVKNGVTIKQATTAISAPSTPIVSCDLATNMGGGVVYILGTESSPVRLEENSQDININHTGVTGSNQGGNSFYMKYVNVLPQNISDYSMDIRDAGRIKIEFSNFGNSNPSISFGTKLLNCRGFVQNNTYNKMYRGITSVFTLNSALANSNFGINFVSNTFDAVQKGIYAQEGRVDLFDSNVFRNIPNNPNIAGDNEIHKNYGLKLVGEQMFDVVNGNIFSGSGAAYSSNNLSYGLLVYGLTNSEFDGFNLVEDQDLAGNDDLGILSEYSGDIQSNVFSKTSYGLYLMGNNPGINIKCNTFAADQNVHRYGSWRVAGGIMGDQGIADISNEPGDQSDPVSNKWRDLCGGGSSKDIASVASFAYVNYSTSGLATSSIPSIYVPDCRSASIDYFLSTLTYFDPAIQAECGNTYFLGNATGETGDYAGISGAGNNPYVATSVGGPIRYIDLINIKKDKYIVEAPIRRPIIEAAINYNNAKVDYDRYSNLERAAFKSINGWRVSDNDEIVSGFLRNSPLAAARHLEIADKFNRKNFRRLSELLSTERRSNTATATKYEFYDLMAQKLGENRYGFDWTIAELEKLKSFTEMPNAAYLPARTLLAQLAGQIYYFPEGEEVSDPEINIALLQRPAILLIPNPIQNEVSIGIEGRSSAHLSILDINGLELYQSNIAEHQIKRLKTSEWKPGIYTIVLRDEMRNILNSDKIIKH